MQRKNFVSMILGTIGGILFALGLCMCLLPEWDVFAPGVVMAAVGAAVLVIMLAVRRRMEGKPAVRLSGRAVGSAALGAAGALTLGVGMCLVMVWSMLVPGILVGIVLLLCLIPLVRGIR